VNWNDDLIEDALEDADYWHLKAVRSMDLLTALQHDYQIAKDMEAHCRFAAAYLRGNK
jgi:hypothetical protein